MTTLKHMILIRDGESLENRLFRTERELAEFLIDALIDDEYVDKDEFVELLAKQDAAALLADPVNGHVPEPEARVYGIADWLASVDVDLYVDELEIPEADSAPAAFLGIQALETAKAS